MLPLRLNTFCDKQIMCFDESFDSNKKQSEKANKKVREQRILFTGLKSRKNHFILSLFFPPGSKESDDNAICEANNYTDLLPEMPRYCCWVEIFYFGF